MSNKTSEGLAQYAEKALKEKWGYVLGTYGQILTSSLLANKQKQGYGVGKYNYRHRNYQRNYIGKFVSDCYGIVKGYVWDKDSRGSAIYNAKMDRNQEGAFRNAKKKGTIKTIPEKRGIVLWMKGHAGIYIGNGYFIECVGSPVGMRKGRISGGRVVSGSKFTHWFEDTYIDYGKGSSSGSTNNIVYYAIDKPDNDKQGVIKLQKDLERLGYPVGIYGANGIFGKDTQSAVVNFQRDNALSKDGSAGPDTLKTIDVKIKELENKTEKYRIIIGDFINKSEAEKTLENIKKISSKSFIEKK